MELEDATARLERRCNFWTQVLLHNTASKCVNVQTFRNDSDELKTYREDDGENYVTRSFVIGTITKNFRTRKSGICNTTKCADKKWTELLHSEMQRRDHSGERDAEGIYGIGVQTEFKQLKALSSGDFLWGRR